MRNLFEQLTKLRRKLDKLHKEYAKEADDEELAILGEQIAALKMKCKETYCNFIDSMESGREIEDILKYDSVAVLTSVMQRLTLLSSTGILSANQAPFGDSTVRIHQIKSITHEQQVLYVKLKLQDIFEKCKRLGPTPTGAELRHVVFWTKPINSSATNLTTSSISSPKSHGSSAWACGVLHNSPQPSQNHF